MVRSGEYSEQAKSLDAMLKDLTATRAGIQAGTARLESVCAKPSACLDLVDSVRLILGAIQLEQATSSDTLYLEQVPVTLSSGNLLFMPMKVWRNRVRGESTCAAKMPYGLP
ncbi:hypothetical protein ASE26_14330 [Duganella sp. Root198D2]|nr:hypothetical protein ASE26_14330 [Duganella sp. Root198D2]